MRDLLRVNHAEHDNIANDPAQKQPLTFAVATFRDQLTTKKICLGWRLAESQANNTRTIFARLKDESCIDTPAIGFAEGIGVKAEPGGLCRRYQLCYLAFMLEPVFDKKIWLIMPEIARLGPEIGKIVRVSHGHSAIKRSETMQSHRAIAKPGLHRKTHFVGFAQH